MKQLHDPDEYIRRLKYYRIGIIMYKPLRHIFKDDGRACKAAAATAESSDIPRTPLQCRSIDSFPMTKHPSDESLKLVLQTEPSQSATTLYKQEGRRVQIARMVYFVALRKCLDGVSGLKFPSRV